MMMACCKKGGTFSWNDCTTNTQMYYSELWLVEEHGRAGRVLLENLLFFPSFVFGPDSETCPLHIQILNRVKEGPKMHFMGQKTCF